MSMKQIHIRLTDAQNEKVQEEAKEKGIAVTALVRSIISSYYTKKK